MPIIDHAVLLVDGIDTARHDLQADGFTVSPGGTHAGGLTQNALIPFADGSYIEVLAFTWPTATDDLSELVRLGLLPWVLSGRTPLDRRFLPRGGKPGLIDLAIGCDEIDSVVSRCRSEGLGVQGPLEGSRVRSDGQRVEWRLAFAEDPHLPFLIEDVTDRGLRVPGGSAAEHPNGATGLARANYVIPPSVSSAFDTLMRALKCPPSTDERVGRTWLLGHSTLSVEITENAASVEPVSIALSGPGEFVFST